MNIVLSLAVLLAAWSGIHRYKSICPMPMANHYDGSNRRPGQTDFFRRSRFGLNPSVQLNLHSHSADNHIVIITAGGMDMRTTMRVLLVGCAISQFVMAAPWAQDKVDGKSAYGLFKCGQCHGDDARTPNNAGTPKIAGLNSRYVTDKTSKMLEETAHQDALGTCGEQPTRAEIQAMAEWISRQAR